MKLIKCQQCGEPHLTNGKCIHCGSTYTPLDTSPLQKLNLLDRGGIEKDKDSKKVLYKEFLGMLIGMIFLIMIVIGILYAFNHSFYWGALGLLGTTLLVITLFENYLKKDIKEFNIKKDSVIEMNHVSYNGVSSSIIKGDHNIIQNAKQCIIYGNHNKIENAINCKVYGNHNRVKGFNNKVVGKHNVNEN